MILFRKIRFSRTRLNIFQRSSPISLDIIRCRFVCGKNDTMLTFKLVLFTCVGVMALFRMWSLISAHGLHYVVFVLIWCWLNLTISFGTTSLSLGQSYSYHDYPSARDATNNINTTHKMHSKNFRTFSREIGDQLQILTLIHSSRLRAR